MYWIQITILATLVVFSAATTDQCHPVCAWQCDSSQCDAICQPVCESPVCAVQCAADAEIVTDSNASLSENNTVIDDADLQDASNGVACNQPDCKIVCPSEACEFGECPRCSTTCEALQCSGSGNIDCAVVCEPVICAWHCMPPEDCPEPTCELVCDESACASSVTLSNATHPNQDADNRNAEANVEIIFTNMSNATSATNSDSEKNSDNNSPWWLAIIFAGVFTIAIIIISLCARRPRRYSDV